MITRKLITGVLYTVLSTVVSLLLHSRSVFEIQGNVGVGIGVSYASAIVEYSSPSKGSLLSRVTTLQRDAIVQTLQELVIYNLIGSANLIHCGDELASI